MEVANKINDEELIIWSEIRQGNITSLGVLYDLYIDSLVAYGIKVSGDKNYTMDCIHDLFVDLYKYKNKLAKTDNVKFYLFSALKRKINKKYKTKEIRLNKNEFNAVVISKNNHENSFEDDLVEKELYQEKVIKLNTLLGQLTEKQRKGLKLRFEEDRSYEDIALALNISVSSARTSIYRAIKTLRNHPVTLSILFVLYFLLKK